MAERLSAWTFLYLAALVAAIPLLIGQVASGLYAPALFTGSAALLGASQTIALLRHRRVARPATILEMTDRTTAPAVPLRIRVVGAHGVCPLGFTVGNAWLVSRDGRFAPAFCRPALQATSQLFPGASGQTERLARCHCPLADAALTFAVSP